MVRLSNLAVLHNWRSPHRSLAERQEALLVQKAVHASVADTLLADEARERERVVLARVAAVLIDHADVDVAGAVLLRRDQAEGSRALARHVEFDDLSLLVLHGHRSRFASLEPPTRAARP